MEPELTRAEVAALKRLAAKDPREAQLELTRARLERSTALSSVNHWKWMLAREQRFESEALEGLRSELAHRPKKASRLTTKDLPNAAEWKASLERYQKRLDHHQARLAMVDRKLAALEAGE